MSTALKQGKGGGEYGCAGSSLAVGTLGALIPELSPHALNLPLPRSLSDSTRNASAMAGSTGRRAAAVSIKVEGGHHQSITLAFKDARGEDGPQKA